MKFKKEYKVRSIAGENVVIMQGRYGSDVTRVIPLNGTSLLLWNELQGVDFDLAQVVELLLDNYDVNEVTAKKDAEAWIEKLKECHLVVDGE
ncbi:MAG: PqqD family protein [Alistipes sp.]|nr:PqqD family protein [Alistipes sp.]